MKITNYENALKKINEPIAFALSPYLSTGLGVVRSLARQKVPVVWLDSNTRQLGFFSKYCYGILCANLKEDEEKYIDFLLNIGEKLNQKGVLFPTGDIETIAILKKRKMLEKYFFIPMSNLETSEILLNKRLFYQNLKKQGVSHPLTYFPVDTNEVKSISKEIKYPCILKPSYSGYFRSEFHTKFFIAKSSEELVPFYENAISRNHDVMIQEIIPGNAKDMYGFNAYYNKNFEPTGTLMYRRIREWPHGFGNGCLIEKVDEPELEKTINSFVNIIGYNGIVDAEFRKDPRDGLFKVIEVNARCWMQVSLPTSCGVNLPYMAYLDAIGKKVEKLKPTKESIKWVFMYYDLISALRCILKSELTVDAWIKSLSGRKEYAVFAKDDLFPFALLYLNTLYIDIPYYLLKNVFKEGYRIRNESNSY
jgi:D-aspartate ligase